MLLILINPCIVVKSQAVLPVDRKANLIDDLCLWVNGITA